ncbi:unnamed protein product [Rhodiola kirilowii]
MRRKCFMMYHPWTIATISSMLADFGSPLCTCFVLELTGEVS